MININDVRVIRLDPSIAPARQRDIDALLIKRFELAVRKNVERRKAKAKL